MEYLLPIGMVVALFGFLLSGFPVAFCLAGCAVLFGLIGAAVGDFRLDSFGLVPRRVFTVIMQSPPLQAVPMFVFMGLMLEKSGLARELLDTAARLLRRLRGGVAISVVLVGAVLGASTGIVGATVVTMGVLSLPAMLRHGYDRGLACGTVAASGTLGQIIPPSIVLILLGDQMSVDVGSLFIGAVVPSAVLVGAFVAYLALRSWLQPHLAPAVEADDDEDGLLRTVAVSLLPPAALIALVLGSIIGGIASPTEAAGCGAVGAILIALVRRRFDLQRLRGALHETAHMTAMVFFVLLGAQFFSLAFRGLHGEDMIKDLVVTLDLGIGSAVILVLVVMFLLGFVLDFLEICFIAIPIFMPILLDLGFSNAMPESYTGMPPSLLLLAVLIGVNLQTSFLTPPFGFSNAMPESYTGMPPSLLLLAVLIGVNLQTSFLTPPFGFSLFYLKGVAPAEIRTTDIYRGVAPFVVLQLLVLAALCLFPELVLWLPRVVEEWRVGG